MTVTLHHNLLLWLLLLLATFHTTEAWWNRLLLGNTRNNNNNNKRRRIVHVVFLMGDDNIEGYASIPHLKELCLTKPDQYAAYCHVEEDKKVKFTTLPDVTVVYDHHRSDQEWQTGPLTVHGPWGATAFMFGPEVPVGHVLRQSHQAIPYNEPIIIIKAGWSGRSLSQDFTAPNAVTRAGGGFQWFRILQDWKQLRRKYLGDILGREYANAHPVVAGIIWWQGYSDLNDKHFSIKQYARDLQNFLMSIRTQLGMFLPIVIAELGGQGTTNASSQELEFRQMQQAVVNLQTNMAYVPTAHHAEQNTTSPFHDDATTEFNQQHYYRRADTMMLIGQDMGNALVELMMTKKRHNAAAQDKNNNSHWGMLMLLIVGLFVTATMYLHHHRPDLLSQFYNAIIINNRDTTTEYYKSAIQLQHQRYRDRNDSEQEEDDSTE